jgi:hypothetical protein
METRSTASRFISSLANSFTAIQEKHTQAMAMSWFGGLVDFFFSVSGLSFPRITDTILPPDMETSILVMRFIQFDDVAKATLVVRPATQIKHLHRVTTTN